MKDARKSTLEVEIIVIQRRQPSHVLWPDNNLWIIAQMIKRGLGVDRVPEHQGIDHHA